MTSLVRGKKTGVEVRGSIAYCRDVSLGLDVRLSVAGDCDGSLACCKAHNPR